MVYQVAGLAGPPPYSLCVVLEIIIVHIVAVPILSSQVNLNFICIRLEWPFAVASPGWAGLLGGERIGLLSPPPAQLPGDAVSQSANG